MPSAIAESTLTVTVSERLTLGGRSYDSTYLKRVPGIKTVLSRILTCPATAETVLYTTDASTITISQFDEDLLKYARITNRDSAHGCDILITNADSDEIAYTLDAGETLFIWNHKNNIEVAHGGAIGDESGAAAATTLAVADGDAANGVTEGQYVQLISTDGLTRNYVISDTNAGGAATGTVLASDTDIGSDTFGNLTTAVTTGVAVGINKSSASQNAVLVQLKAAIEHSNGHNGRITCGSVPVEANGSQNFTITQATLGDDGNTVTTTDITNLTSADFTSGVDHGWSGKASITSITAQPNNADCDIEVYLASQ